MKSKKPQARKEIGFSPPLEIVIPSDMTVMQLVGNRNGQYTYKYTVGKWKKGMQLTLDEEGIKRLQNSLEFSKFIRPATS